jgi:FtsZ-binding cell division protein ZapB
LIQEEIKKLLDNKAKVEKENNLAIKACSDLGKKEKTLKENIASMQESLKILVEKEQ